MQRSLWEIQHRQRVIVDSHESLLFGTEACTLCGKKRKGGDKKIWFKEVRMMDIMRDGERARETLITVYLKRRV